MSKRYLPPVEKKQYYLHARVLLFIIALTCFVSNSFSAIITSTATGGNWGTGGTWVGGVMPAAGDQAVIATTGGNSVTVNTSTRTCAGITINANARLICTTIGLIVNGNWINNGTFTQGTATVTFGATGTVNDGAGTANFNNVIISSGSNRTVSTDMTVSGTFVFAAVAANTTVTISGNNSLAITGAVTMPRPNAGMVATIAVGAGTVTMGSLTMQGTVVATGTRTDVISISTGTCTITGTVTLSGTTGCVFTFTGAGKLVLGNTVSTGPPTLTPSTGTVEYNRAGVQTPWATTYNNLTLGGTGAKTIGAMTVNGMLSMEGSATASAAPTYGVNASLQYNTATNRTVGPEWPATFTAGRLQGGVIVNNTGIITFNAAKTMGTGMPMTIANGANLAMSTFLLTLNDDLINNGGAIAGSGGVTLAGTAAQAIGAFTTTGTLTSTKTGGTATLTGPVAMNALTMNGAGGTLNLGAGLNHNSSGAVTLTNGTLNGGSSTLLVGGNWAGTGTNFTANNSTINFDNNGAQTLSATGVKTFYNLVFSGSGNKATSAGSTLVNNILSLEGTAVPATTFPTYGTGATLVYNTATSRTAGAEWVTPFVGSGGVVIANTGTIAINANKVFNAAAPFTIQNGATFNAGNFDLSFANDFTNNGTWTNNSGDVTLTGTATQSISGFTSTGTLLMAKTGGVATLTSDVNAANLTINGAGGTLSFGTGLTHTFSGVYTSLNGTVNANNSTMNIDGSVVPTGGAFNPGTGTSNFRGNTTQAIPPVTWYNLTFSGSGLKTFSGTTGVLNNMTINNGATIDLGTIEFQIGGSGNCFVNNGTFIASTSTFSYLGAGSATITGVNYYNLNSANGDRIFSTLANIGIAGAFTPGVANYTVAGSTVDFNGGIDQNIPTFTFDKLVVSNNGIKKILATIIVACQTIDINDAASVEIDADGAGKLNVLQ